jgi:ketosteroid isomerase-like protein
MLLSRFGRHLRGAPASRSQFRRTTAILCKCSETAQSTGGIAAIMGIEENRATALELVASLGAGSPDLSLMTEDAAWWAPGRGTYGNAEFAGIARAFAGMFAAPSIITVHGVTAEGDRVAIEAEGHAELTNGKTYRNRYHYLFIFRGGKICEARLYNDTAHAASMWD